MKKTITGSKVAQIEKEKEALQQQVEELQRQVDELSQQVQELNDIKLRQMAEFENFRRRTNKEKQDLMNSAGARIFKDLLPVIDDFERAIDATDDEGVKLIYNKFMNFLHANNVTVIETEGQAFNTDEHEAVTLFNAGEEKKGMIIECTQKGYKLGDKVIRYAKVVVGE